MTLVYIVQAAVTLISFGAFPNVANQKILLVWETGSELDFAGFRLLRSLDHDSGYEPLLDEYGNPLTIPAIGEGGAGAQYLYEDTDVELGEMYYYKLEMIDLGGDISYSDIVSAYLGYTPTPTASYTLTPTSSTPSATKTQGTPTSTRTKTKQPTTTITRTPSPYRIVTYTLRPQATSTFTETPTTSPTPTLSPTVTTTLAPLPSLTLLFPVRTSTPTNKPTPTLVPTISPSPTLTTTPTPEPKVPLRVSFLWGLILLLWVMLAVFLIAYLRKISN